MSEPRYHLDDFNTIPGYAVGDNGSVDHDSWLPINLADLPAKPPVQPTLGQVGDIGLLYPGKRHVFSGPQESAKTLAAYYLGLQVIRAGGTIIIIDFEMGEYDARDRLQDLGCTTHDFSHLHYIAPETPATRERISLLISLTPQLVIVDAAAGAYDVQGLDDNKRSDVEKLSALYIRMFWKARIASIMLDHVVKDKETRGSYAIGSERKIGGADVHLGFSVITPISRGHTGLYKVTTHKDRGGYLKRGTLAEMELASHPESHAITCAFNQVEDVPDGQPWMPTKQMQKVSQMLEKQSEPVSRKQILDEIGGREDIARKAIDHLVRLGYATETAGPHNSKLVETSRSFTVYEWEKQAENPANHNLIPPNPVATGITSADDLIPPNPDLIPDGVIPPNPGTPPPYRGEAPERDDVRSPTEPHLIPDRYDWIDELTPRENEDPPADLHDTTTEGDHP